MLELIIVRHGQSVADIEERHEGRADFPLTNLGREQAEKLTIWLENNIMIDYIICSPLKRASETAEIINTVYNKKIIYDERLMEWNNGVLAGLLRTEAHERYPIPEGGRKYYQKVPGGESVIEFRARAEEFLAELLNNREYEGNICSILIVAHGGIINMLFHSFLSLPVSNDIAISCSDTGVNIWRVNSDKRTIVLSNGNMHLKD